MTLISAVTNDVIGSPAHVNINVQLQFPVNSTYTYFVSNVTVRTADIASTDFTTPGASVTWANVTTGSPLLLNFNLAVPTIRARAVHVLMVSIERFKRPNVTTFVDELLSYTVSVNIEGIQSPVPYINQSFSAAWLMKQSYVAQPVTIPTETNTTGTTATLGYAYAVGYTEPVMVGLGVLLFLLFIILALAACALVWMLNKPGAEAAEAPLQGTGRNNLGRQFDSEQPFHPNPAGVPE